MYSQVVEEGQQNALMREIIDHKSDGKHLVKMMDCTRIVMGNNTKNDIK